MKFIKEAKTLQERKKLYESYRASSKTLTEDVKTVKIKDVKVRDSIVVDDRGPLKITSISSGPFGYTIEVNDNGKSEKIKFDSNEDVQVVKYQEPAPSDKFVIYLPNVGRRIVNRDEAINFLEETIYSYKNDSARFIAGKGFALYCLEAVDDDGSALYGRNNADEFISNLKEYNKIYENKDITEQYWINNQEVMNEVNKLGKELEDDGFKYHGDKYSGSDYYDFYTKLVDDKPVCKAVQYNHNGAQIIDITVNQLMGYEPIDSFEQMRHKLGNMLLPKNKLKEAIITKEFLATIPNSEDFKAYGVDVDLDSAREEIPEAPETPEDMGIAGVLNNLIIDEWEAIDGYNSAIVTLADLGKYDEVEVLKDIVNEENIHVGQLQQIMKSVSPNAESIGEGEVEAAEQLNKGDIE